MRREQDKAKPYKRLSFDDACRQFVHRFTMDFTPSWALRQRTDATYYAPQYASDREWYNAYLFPGDNCELGLLSGRNKHCEQITPCTWPLGTFLSEPYKRRAVA